jgi:DNA-binding Xre family transcriptional regulator
MIGGDIMITFDPLRDYMQKQGKSIYSLSRDKIVGGATLDKIRADSQGVTLDTINRICNYLKCKPSNIIAHKPDQPGE